MIVFYLYGVTIRLVVIEWIIDGVVRALVSEDRGKDTYEMTAYSFWSMISIFF